MSRVARQRFSLVEVLVALVILGLVLGTAMGFASQAGADVIRSRQDWEAAHAMTQATEYYLLANPRDLSVPSDLLPEGYRAQCQIERATDTMPGFAQEVRQGWILARYRIEVRDSRGETVGTREVLKIIREDAL